MKYCAFLRGVNVKGTSMKMAEVCLVFEKLGLLQVSSVLATGNIIFSSDLNDEFLKQHIEKAMSENFNYECFLFLKNEKEVDSICRNNPFLEDKNYHTYVIVANASIENTLWNEFNKSENTKEEDAKIVNDVLYWKVKKGNTLDSQFGKILAKKKFKDQFTSRNFNTFEKVFTKIR